MSPEYHTMILANVLFNSQVDSSGFKNLRDLNWLLLPKKIP